MNNYLITVEDRDGRLFMYRIEAKSEESAKYEFWKQFTKSFYVRIVSVALTARKFQDPEE